jgi:hypothetical protein
LAVNLPYVGSGREGDPARANYGRAMPRRKRKTAAGSGPTGTGDCLGGRAVALPSEDLVSQATLTNWEDPDPRAASHPEDRHRAKVVAQRPKPNSQLGLVSDAWFLREGGRPTYRASAVWKPNDCVKSFLLFRLSNQSRILGLESIPFSKSRVIPAARVF